MLKIVILSLIYFTQSELADELKIGEKAPIFVLHDAKDKIHNSEDLSGKVIFLIIGNRKIRKEDNKWAKAIKNDFGKIESFACFIIGDLRSVPRFIPKSFIKKQLIKRPPPTTFLLDWDGKVHKAFHADPKLPNLYLIDGNGILQFHEKVKFDLKVYQYVKNKIKKEIKKLDDQK